MIEKNRYNLFDYLFWVGNFSFSQLPFNQLDALVFAIISYIPFDLIFKEQEKTFLKMREKKISVAKASLIFFEEMDVEAIAKQGEFDEKNIWLLHQMAKSKRYNLVKIFSYVNKFDEDIEKQFCALTLELPQKKYVVSYRGTDNKLVSWKEDFNLSFMSVIPSQSEASLYFNKIAKQHIGTFYLVGHSKGGNLAAYAALHSLPLVQKRIAAIYNFDGPGFGYDTIETKLYKKIEGKLITVVPRSSVVGMLLQHEEPYTVVESSNLGLLQHDPFSWEIGFSSFKEIPEISKSSQKIGATLRTWLKKMDKSQIQIFVDTIYDILIATDAKTVDDLAKEGGRLPIRVVRSIYKLDKETRAIVISTIATLLSSTFHNDYKN